jgi:hypothetical protein
MLATGKGRNEETPAEIPLADRCRRFAVAPPPQRGPLYFSWIPEAVTSDPNLQTLTSQKSPPPAIRLAAVAVASPWLRPRIEETPVASSKSARVQPLNARSR